MNNIKNIFSLFFTLFLVSILTISCRRDLDVKNTTGRLSLSADTLVFDTLFTTYNSPTARLYVRNRTNGRLDIDFMGIENTNTDFSLIIDGIKSNQVKNYSLSAGDSLLIFASYRAKTQTVQNYLAEELITFKVNGHVQQVVMKCFSVNGVMLYKSLPSSNYIMQDTAYIIRDTLSVGVGQTLTITNKARLYFDNGAAILVRGTLKVQGTKEHPITFQGVRLDDKYKARAGQWSGIYFFTTAKDNDVHYAEIKNGYYGLYVAYPQADNNVKLVVSHTKIHDMVIAGLTGAETKIYAYNTLIYDCGQSAVQMLSGGTYQYDYCTFYGDASKYTHDRPTFIALDYFGDPRNPITTGALNLIMRNTIVHGNGKPEDEFFIGLVTDLPFGYNITHCLLKTKNLANQDFISNPSHNNIINQNPEFESTTDKKFVVRESSPAKNQALPISGITLDIEDNARSAVSPTIGAYE
ncbi:MAG: hypothetical protein NZ455_12195 [Bacteroidia bacterium]|nr:hypothetical protein [Bacteroidia bacterium]MDW8345452.1 hypothetical protein [Bacteroidia bacterium]